MNFLIESQNSRNIIGLLVIMFGVLSVKSQPITTLDTGTFIPLSSYIDERTNEFSYWDDIFDANYMFYGKIHIDNNTADTLIVSSFVYQYIFSKSNIRLFWPHNASHQMLYSKSNFEFSPDNIFIKLPPNSQDTLEIFLYGEFSDYFVSLIKDFKNSPAVCENFLRKHKRYENLIRNKCKLYLDLVRPTWNPIEVDVKSIKIVSYKGERDKIINSLWESYIEPNMNTFE